MLTGDDIKEVIEGGSRDKKKRIEFEYDRRIEMLLDLQSNIECQASRNRGRRREKNT